MHRTSSVPVWNDTLQRAGPDDLAAAMNRASETIPPPRLKFPRTEKPTAPASTLPVISPARPKPHVHLSTNTPAPRRSVTPSVSESASGQLEQPSPAKKRRVTEVASLDDTPRAAPPPLSTDEDYVYFDADADAEELYEEALKFLQRSSISGLLRADLIYVLTTTMSTGSLAPLTRTGQILQVLTRAQRCFHIACTSRYAVMRTRRLQAQRSSRLGLPAGIRQASLHVVMMAPARIDVEAPTYLTDSNMHAALAVKQSRLDIVSALLSFSSKYKFLVDGKTNVLYDMQYLEDKQGLLLICYAEITDQQEEHRLSLDQSFVLRRKEDDREDRYVLSHMDYVDVHAAHLLRNLFAVR